MPIEIVKADEICDICDCFDHGQKVLKFGFATICWRCLRQLELFLKGHPDIIEQIKAE